MRFDEDEIHTRLCRIENIFIETEIIRRAQKALMRRIGSDNRPKGLRRKPKIAWMTADTGCGKTSLVERFVADVNQSPIGQVGDGRLLAVHVNLPTPCTVKTMGIAILKALRDPLSHKNTTTGDNTDRIVALDEAELGFSESSSLSDQRTAAAILSATEGLFGNLAQLFSEAAEISMDREEGPDAITIHDLAAAFDELPYEGANPFKATRRKKTVAELDPALNSHARNARTSRDARA